VPAAPTPALSAPAVEEAPAPQDGLAAYIDATLRGLAAAGDFSGAVLVAGRDGVVLSQGYGLADREEGRPNTPTTRFRLGSLTKQLTAMAVLVLQQQGRLDVGDPICSYLPDCPAAWQPITIHQLLSHTSGIPDLTRFPDFEATKQTPSPPGATIARFANRPLAFQPGTQWDYSNSNYIVLGAIVERASGQPYAEFMQQAIFEPLGMRDSGYETGQSGLAVGYANRSGARVEDLYRWDRALAASRLVPAALQDQMFTAHAAIPGSDGTGYGYGWEIGQESGHRYQAHAGGIEGFSSFIVRYPDDQVTVIMLGNQQDVNPRAVVAPIAGAILEGRPLPASAP
jgi:CubicO group peptidase (beta-lactamase class C family)